MIKYVIIPLLLCSFGASAQSWSPTGTKTRFLNGLGIPVKAPYSILPGDSAQIILNPADSLLYFTYKGAFRAVGSTVNVYNSDGTLTGSRDFNGGNHDFNLHNAAYLNFQSLGTGHYSSLSGTHNGQLNTFADGTQAYSELLAGDVSVPMQASIKVRDNGDILVTPGSGLLKFIGLPTSTDTINYKPLVQNTSTNEVKRLTSWPGSGGTWEQSLTAQDTIPFVGFHIVNMGHQGLILDTGYFKVTNKVNTLGADIFNSFILTDDNDRISLQSNNLDDATVGKLVIGTPDLTYTSSDNSTFSAGNSFISATDLSSVTYFKASNEGLIFARLTVVERDAIASPAIGLMVYLTDSLYTSQYNGSAWVALGGGSSQWTTTGSDIYYNTGNVGIGTSTPVYKLDVVGDANISNSTSHSKVGDITRGYYTDYDADNGQINFVTGVGETLITTGNISFNDDFNASGISLSINASPGNYRSIGFPDLSGTVALTDADNPGNFTVLGDLTTGGTNTLSGLSGTGSRAVLADASGVLSAPVSDRRVKQNITDLDYGLNTIMALRPVSFYYKKEWQNYGTDRQVGFIAQEVEKLMPNSVFTTPSTGLKGINKEDIIAVLVRAVQQQQKEINDLKKRIK